MKKILLSALALTVALPALAAADAQTIDTAALTKAATRACQRAERVQIGFSGECSASALQRRVLTGNVVEYTFDVRVGTGPYDVIGLHRVVREAAPFQPIQTDDSVLLLHGDIWGFRAAFLADTADNFPVHLAQNNVDVWGIDQRWIRVPATETTFTFMKDWGFAHDIKDLYVALSVARGVRLFTGNGFDKMHLLGWSRGGMIGYAYLNAETQVPTGLRNVDGFIPVDIYFKTNDPDFHEAACVRSGVQEGAWSTGAYQNATGSLAQAVAFFATTAPADGSQFFPDLTNYQAALLLGGATFIISPPDQQNVPFYHLTGASFAAEPAPSGLPVPTGLLYSPEPSWLTALQGASPFQPTRQIADAELVLCEAQDVPFDDHLAEITNPVLYVGAGGGFGEYGIYTTTLLGSTDVTTHVVNLQPAAARAVDFGHSDLFLGTDADTLVWQPILDWILAH